MKCCPRAIFTTRPWLSLLVFGLLTLILSVTSGFAQDGEPVPLDDLKAERQDLEVRKPVTEVNPVTFLKSPGRILFLGDSITHAGHYITMLETYFQQQGDTIQGLEWINLGLPSETCSGLSEPAHPFPRPNVHDRLDRALEKVTPDVVVACYGMNDGIYHPFDEERFRAYQEGITTLVEKTKAVGAFVVLLTPPPFDPLPMRQQGKLVPADGEAFAWNAIYEDYDEVIARYAEWIRSQEDLASMVIDIHTPIAEALAQQRETDPDYTMSTDGVHLNEDGHLIMVETILTAWEKTPEPLDPALYAQLSRRQELMQAAWLSHVGHERPGMKPGLPLDEAQAEAKAMAGVIAALTANVPQQERFRRLEGKVAELAEEIRAARFRLDSHLIRFLFPAPETPVALHNGRNLDGWEGDPRFWMVDAEGAIRGANEGVVRSSTYLFSDNAYREFRLIFEVKQTVSPQHSTMHSAVAVLGERIEDDGPNPYGFRGPLLMFCHDWGIWDAYRRNRVEPAGQRGPLRIGDERIGDWNLVEFLVLGNRIQCVANGTQVFDFTDKPEMLQTSPIGLQLHSNEQPQEFRFRHLYISENPEDRLATLGMMSEGLPP